MKKIFILFLTLMMVNSLSVLAQKNNKTEMFKVTKVSKPYYFDKSKPLREVTPIKPYPRERDFVSGKKGNIFKEVKPEETNKLGIIDPVAQTKQGNEKSRFPIVNFEGVGRIAYVTPPDTDGEVGPNHFFQMVNLSFAIFDKSGNILYGPASNATLWDGFDGPWSSTNDGDPVVIYDERADRWIASQFAVNTPNNKYYQLLAVSETEDPTGAYYRYAFEYDEMNDYPKISAWTDSYIATYNMFHRTFMGGTFLGAAVAAFDREKLLAGNPDAEQQFFQLSTEYYGVLSADIDGQNLPPDGSPCHLIHMKRSGSRGINIFELALDWENPSNSSLEMVNILTPEMYSTYTPGKVPQPNTSTQLDNFMGQALFRLPYRNFNTHESMVLNHAVAVNSIHGIRWYELRKTGDGDWEIYQQSTFAPDDGVHRWMGSIAINGSGDIALGYSASNGQDVFPSIRYAGRTANAPLNMFNMEEIEIMAGSASQSMVDRWGDYACMSVDPSNDSVFWFTTEYIKSGGWKTRVAAFKLTGSSEPPTVEVGQDTLICESEPYTTNPVVTNANGYLWESSGTGNFAPNNTSLVCHYIRSNEDVENGGVWLKLTVTGYSGDVVVDSLYLSFARKATVDAGVTDSICKDETYTLNPTVENAATHVWSTNGDGTFDDATLLNATYTPGTNDTINANNYVELKLTVTSNEPCTQTKSDKVKLFIKDCIIGIDIVPDDKNLIVQPNPSHGNFTVKMNGIKSKTTDVTILDSNGKVIITETLNTQNGRINKNYSLDGIEKGLYILKIEQNNTVSTKKFLIN